MHRQLQHDLSHFDEILQQAFRYACDHLEGLQHRPAAAQQPDVYPQTGLPEAGVGAAEALSHFRLNYDRLLSASPGPRYFGFVTGGATPAAVAADWLVSVFDQNAQLNGDTCAPHIELEAIGYLKQLFGLPDAFSGSFVSGATMANFVGIALARQWLGKRYGIDVAADGIARLPPIRVLSGTAHSSTAKALSMAGIGRDALVAVPTLPGREAIDPDALEAALLSCQGQPVVVVANAGTVNTVDFDDLDAIAALKARYPFWLHVDAAFGAFAACSPRHAHLVSGLGGADSVTIDAHKWLNVPYDCAMQFTRHLDLQLEVFRNHSSYLPAPAVRADNMLHLTPENSRRFRALPVWLSLLAYGRTGLRELVERDCAMAARLGALLRSDDRFELLAPVRMNVVCFSFRQESQRASEKAIRDYLERLRMDGTAFFTATLYHGTPAIRAAVSNWRTREADIDAAWQALLRCLPPSITG